MNLGSNLMIVAGSVGGKLTVVYSGLGLLLASVVVYCVSPDKV
jgi:hypothetical protein